MLNPNYGPIRLLSRSISISFIPARWPKQTLTPKGVSVISYVSKNLGIPGIPSAKQPNYLEKERERKIRELSLLYASLSLALAISLSICARCSARCDPIAQIFGIPYCYFIHYSKSLISFFIVYLTLPKKILIIAFQLCPYLRR